MFSSLRSRLLVWYTALVAAVMTAFGALVCYVAWRERLVEIDAVLQARAETLAAALQPAAAGAFDLTLTAAPVTDLAETMYHVIWTPAGELIDRSDPGLDVAPPPAAGALTRNGRREVSVRGDSGALVLAGLPLDEARADIWALAGTMAVVGGAAVALALVGGWALVGRALRPIDRISLTARAMVEGDFAARIPIDRVETELGQLAHALNEAFDRLHASLERQRRFTADASHELRTPLATISTETQWATVRERESQDYRRSLEVCRRAAARMQGVVERLLSLARAEAAADDDRRVAVRLDEIVDRAAADLQPLAAARRIDMSVHTAPVVLAGDPDRLLDAITNVVANAIQYNVEGGSLRIVLDQIDGHARLVVTDTGIGIAARDLPRVFEPFFRTDPARSRDGGGAGLGLAATRAIVQRHGGDIQLQSAPGQGTTVTIRWGTRQPE